MSPSHITIKIQWTLLLLKQIYQSKFKKATKISYSVYITVQIRNTYNYVALKIVVTLYQPINNIRFKLTFQGKRGSRIEKPYMNTSDIIILPINTIQNLQVPIYTGEKKNAI